MVGQHGPRSGVGLRTQPDRAARALPAQIQVAVLQAGFLARLVVELERQRGALVQHLELRRVDLDGTGGDLEVLVALGTHLDLAGDLDAVLGAQSMRLLEYVAGTEHHLGNARRITEIDEDHSAVIAPPGHPAGESDGLLSVLGS